MDLFKIAKYPFIEEAKEWVRKEKIDVEEILFDGIYERARNRGVERVMQALYKGIINDAILVNEVDCMMEVLSYPIARMLVVAIESDYLLRRYALAEAKKAYENMKRDSPEIIIEIGKEFGIEFKDGCIHSTDYLKFAPTWDIKWKLVNRELRQGYVRLDKNEIARLLQEAIRKKLYDELSYLFAPQEVKKVFKEEIIAIRNKIALKERKETEKYEDINFEDFPPCIKNLISAIKSGINVPHVGRFTVVTFLNAIGQSTNEILKIFSSIPDFNEEKTLYQIEHITGKISGTIYSTPKCDTIRTWGLCYPDESCKKIWHPLIYYRKKRRK